MCFSALVTAFIANSKSYYVQERPIRGKQRAILVKLMEHPMTVTDIALTVGISTTAVSYNLRKLKEMGLYRLKKLEGRRRLS